jgi:hypothetical protein
MADDEQLTAVAAATARREAPASVGVKNAASRVIRRSQRYGYASSIIDKDVAIQEVASSAPRDQYGRRQKERAAASLLMVNP